MWKQCNTCGEVKELAAYPMDKGKRCLFTHKCKACLVVYRKQLRSNRSPEKILRDRERHKQWVADNREQYDRVNAKYRAENKDKMNEKRRGDPRIAARMKKYHAEHRAEGCERSARFRKLNPDKIKEYRKSPASVEYIKNYQLNNPVKARGHRILTAALAKGTLVRSTECETCGEESRTIGHHDDYLKPLDIRWLCRSCHAAWHKADGPGING